jgi:hypothetical protein
MKMTMGWMQGVLLGAVICSAAMAQGTPAVKDDLFEGTQIFEKGASEVTEISMDPKSLGMVGGRAHNMILNVVKTYEYDQPGLYKMEDVEVYRKKVSTGDWFCSVHTRDLKHGGSTDICSKRRTDDLEEKAIISVEPKELTFIHTITKRGANEHGELGEFMPLAGMPALAMLEPELMTLRMQMPDMADVQVKVDAAMPKLKINIDKAEIDKAMKDAEKQLKTMKVPDVQVVPDDAAKSDDQKVK